MSQVEARRSSHWVSMYSPNLYFCASGFVIQAALNLSCPTDSGRDGSIVNRGEPVIGVSARSKVNKSVSWPLSRVMAGCIDLIRFLSSSNQLLPVE